MEEALVWILDRLHHIGLSPDAESLAAGLLCGDRSLFSTEAMHDIRDAGMSHLLAVSGLHIGLLWGLLLFLLRRLLLIPYYFGWNAQLWNDVLRMLTLVLLWLYVWMIGFPPSAVRAAILISIAQISPFFLIESWSWENLATAALIMLCYDPMLLGDVGFQLSFAATAGILAFRPLLTYPHRPRHQHSKTLDERLYPVTSLFWLTFSAQLFTLPLVAYYFHHLPLLGWVQGFLVVPLLALLIYTLLALLSVPASWGMFSLFGETLYHWLSLPVEALSWWVFQVAHWVSRAELWLVGGRVEFYPSLFETVLLELIILGLTWACLGLRKCYSRSSSNR